MSDFINDVGVLSEDELKEKLNGLVPNDIQYWANNGYSIYYIFSNTDRSAIVLSSGETKDQQELNGKALDELFKYS